MMVRNTCCWQRTLLPLYWSRNRRRHCCNRSRSWIIQWRKPSCSSCCCLHLSSSQLLSFILTLCWVWSTLHSICHGTKIFSLGLASSRSLGRSSHWSCYNRRLGIVHCHGCKILSLWFSTGCGGCWWLLFLLRRFNSRSLFPSLSCHK